MDINEMIMVLGFKEAGKTVYMSGMYNLLSTGLKRFNLYTDPDTDRFLAKIWEDIIDGKNRSWPILTDERRYYNFKLSYDFKEILNFRWMDYPGAAITNPGFNLIDDLKKEIASCAGLILLVNGCSFVIDKSELSKRANKIYKKYMGAASEDGKSSGTDEEKRLLDDAYNAAYRELVIKNLKNNSDKATANFIGSLGRELNGGLPPIAIVITKSDLIEDRWIDQIDSIIKDEDAFAAVFGQSDNNERLVMMEAVTVGEGIEDGEDADPIGIELPLAFAVLCALKRLIERHHQRVIELDATINKKRNVITKWLDEDEIKAAQKEKDQLEETIGILSKGVVPLLGLFDDEKMIYKNGRPTSLKNYFNKMIQQS